MPASRRFNGLFVRDRKTCPPGQLVELEEMPWDSNLSMSCLSGLTAPRSVAMEGG